MKKILTLVLSGFLLCTQIGKTQEVQTSSFDKSLQQLTDVIAGKLSDKQLKIAVWDLSELDGSISPIGKYIAEDVAINLSDRFHVVNRNQLNTLLNENKLKHEGFIDPVTIKEVKRLSDIDLIITGTVSVLTNHIKITLQALDADANITAATKGEVPMNDDVKELLGINSPGKNKGFNSPLNSNEQINNPETVSSDCEEKGTGDFCFSNTTKYELNVQLLNQYSWYMQDMIVSPGQQQCFYSLKAGVYQYIVKLQRRDYQSPTYHGGKGNIKVEKCKSKTFIIK